jgi:hypothetical protein
VTATATQTKPEPHYGDPFADEPQRPGLLDEVIAQTQAVLPPSALETIVRSEIDVQISTAKRFPRSIRQFQIDAKSMACLDEATAARCFYSLPRDGKQLEGPSVRLAEIVASAWQNLRCTARVIAIDAQFVTAQGYCHDLERNVANSVEVRRRITGKGGRRFSDDMIGVTANAACSVAFRNAVFKTVPFAYVQSVYDEARQTAVGNAQTLAARREKALAYWSSKGVNKERLLATLGRRAVEDIDLNDIARLLGLMTAIKDGETSVDEAFPPVGSEPPKAGSRTERLAAEIAGRANGNADDRSDDPADEPGVDLLNDDPAALEKDDLRDDLCRRATEADRSDDLKPLYGELQAKRDWLGMFRADAVQRCLDARDKELAGGKKGRK